MVNLTRFSKKEIKKHLDIKYTLWSTSFRHISDQFRHVVVKQSEFFNISQGPHIAIKDLLNLP